jgi:hypothetical protein
MGDRCAGSGTRPITEIRSMARYRLPYPPMRPVGWRPPLSPPTRPAWVPAVIIEPTDAPFAANQQSMAQIWEAVRRASDVEIARRYKPPLPEGDQ